MSNEQTKALEPYTSKGLTPEEAKLVANWIEAGRPGIANIRADFLFSIFNLGYTCQEIHKHFPEYALPAILWARAKFDWDARRAAAAGNSAKAIAMSAPNIGAEAIRHLLALVQATHVRNERELMAYLAAPDREKPPTFLPATLHQYSQLLQTLKELMTEGGKKGAADDSANKPGLPAIHIHATGGQVHVTSEERAIEVKNALKERAIAKRNGNGKPSQ
jgi:hypothetical protein